MYSKENEKASQVISWVRKSNENRLIWDILCGDSWLEYTVGNCIEMLEKTVAEEAYEFALILITRLSRCKYMGEAITNVVINRINAPSLDYGVISECIREFKMVANQKGIMEMNMQV